MLEEIGEPYELTVVSWEQGSGEEHRARHPLGRVPVVQFDEVTCSSRLPSACISRTSTRTPA